MIRYYVVILLNGIFAGVSRDLADFGMMRTSRQFKNEERNSSETKCLRICSSVLLNQEYSFQNVSYCLCCYFVFMILSSSGQFGIDIRET